MRVTICAPAEGFEYKSQFVLVCLLGNIMSGCAFDTFFFLYACACICVKERERGGKIVSGFLSLCPSLLELIAFSPLSKPRKETGTEVIHTQRENVISQLVPPSPFTLTTD